MIPWTPAREYQNTKGTHSEQSGLRDGNAMLGGKLGELCRIFGADRQNFTRVTTSKGSGKVDEIRNGDTAVIVQIALGPARAADAEIGGQIDEIGNRHTAIKI